MARKKPHWQQGYLHYPIFSSGINLQPIMWPLSPCSFMYFLYSSQKYSMSNRGLRCCYSFFFPFFIFLFSAFLIAFFFYSSPFRYFYYNSQDASLMCLRLRCVAFRYSSEVPNEVQISAIIILKYCDQMYFWPDDTKKYMIFWTSFRGHFRHFNGRNPHTSRRTDIRPAHLDGNFALTSALINNFFLKKGLNGS